MRSGVSVKSLLTSLKCNNKCNSNVSSLVTTTFARSLTARSDGRSQLILVDCARFSSELVAALSRQLHFTLTIVRTKK